MYYVFISFMSRGKKRTQIKSLYYCYHRQILSHKIVLCIQANYDKKFQKVMVNNPQLTEHKKTHNI